MCTYSHQEKNLCRVFACLVTIHSCTVYMYMSTCVLNIPNYNKKISHSLNFQILAKVNVILTFGILSIIRRKVFFCKLCQSVQTVCSNIMKTSYTCRKFLHFGKCRKIFTKVVPHCLISTLTLTEFFLFT